MTLTDKQRAALNADMPREEVSERKGGGGRALSYIEGWRVIDLLNEILGPGGWSYEARVSVCAGPKPSMSKEGKERWAVSYLGTCTLRVDDCTITDVGYGHGLDPDEGQAHESAGKEAATDALKRCAKSLGRRMGLAIYSKTQEHVAEPETVKGPTPADVVTAFDGAENEATYAAARATLSTVWPLCLDQAWREKMAAAQKAAAARIKRAA